jgi:hypothetical protein
MLSCGTPIPVVVVTVVKNFIVLVGPGTDIFVVIILLVDIAGTHTPLSIIITSPPPPLSPVTDKGGVFTV